MNINQEALYHYLKSKDIKTEFFFLEDYKLIADKSLAYKNKNKEFPSVTFLLEYSDKLSEDSEQKDRIEDILYALSKYKPELESVQEVNELLLQEFKTESIKKLTKQIASALLEGNENRITLLSQKINDVSKIELGGEDFRENDIKRDIKSEDIRMELIPSGFIPSAHESLSQIARGSVISLIGSTGEGKSVMSLNACLNQYLNGYNTIMVSYELPRKSVIARMISTLSEVPISEINEGIYTTEEAEIRIQSAKAMLEYDITFEKAFNRILKGKGFEDCKVRDNYLKIIAVASAGEDGISELPDSEDLLKMIEEYKPDFITIDLISEVTITKSSGSYETDLANLTRDFKRKALKHSAVVILVSQPSSESVGGLIYPKYCKAIRSSADSNIIIASTSEMRTDNIGLFIVEKVRHSMRGICTPVIKEFQYMRFKSMEDEETLRMEDVFIELAKDFKKKGNDK